MRGEVVKAFIVLTKDYEDHDKEKLTVELQEHVKQITAAYKYPRKVRLHLTHTSVVMSHKSTRIFPPALVAWLHACLRSAEQKGRRTVEVLLFMLLHKFVGEIRYMCCDLAGSVRSRQHWLWARKRNEFLLFSIVLRTGVEIRQKNPRVLWTLASEVLRVLTNFQGSHAGLWNCKGVNKFPHLKKNPNWVRGKKG